MRLLLDTHAFVWWSSDNSQLSPKARALLQDEQNILFLSLVSIWELQIKKQLGKFKFSLPLAQAIQEQQDKNGLELLEISTAHIFTLDQLPPIHRDPFDRMLIAQAMSLNLTLLSADSDVSQYPVSVVW